MMMGRRGKVAVGILWVGAASAAVLADGTVSGEARYETVKGRPGDYKMLHEWKLFLTPDDGSRTGYSRLVGAGCTPSCGWYSITAPADWHTMLITKSTSFARPYVVRDVQIVNGQTLTLNAECPTDYACYHVQENQWSWGTPRYQTFVATGTSVVRIQWLLAGWDNDGDRVQVSIHEDNGGDITTWPQIGPAKNCVVDDGDSWVGFRSGDIPTTPHRRYALKLQGVNGVNFGIRHRVKDGYGYAQGRAFDAEGNPQNLDLNATVFSDNDGTIIPYMVTTPGKPELLGAGGGTWGQTFKATAVSLAGVECYAAGGHVDDVVCEWRIREGGPGGPQVGVTKSGRAVHEPPYAVGVSYAPGEIPLVPGQTYFIELKGAPGRPVITAYLFPDKSANAYPYGDAYLNGVKQFNEDLEMTIIEYKPWYAPAVVNPSFEDYGGYLDGWHMTKLDGKGPDDPPNSSGAFGIEPPDGGHFAGKVASGSVFNFSMGQVLEVFDPPGGTTVYWSLAADVQLHSRSSVGLPDNVHQVWEIGWNSDGSMPAGVNRCDHYQVVASIDGNHTGNDAKSFAPLALEGTISTGVAVQAVALRVRMFSDAVAMWSMSHIDNVSFITTPSEPYLQVEPESMTAGVWIRDNPPDGALAVTNIGPGTISFTIEDDADWLSVHPLSESSSGESVSVAVIYDAAHLSGGEHTAMITISSEEAWNKSVTIPVTLVVETVAADFDKDADGDLDDFSHLQACLSGSGIGQINPDCLDTDLDGDSDTDAGDVVLFLRCMSGSNVPAQRDCVEQPGL